MPVTRVGLVYYEDDPEKRIFRHVFPIFDDSELDNPEWTTVRVDPARKAVLIRVPIAEVLPLTGTP